ncbi:MAG: DUF2490 domain-containing protein [Bacteroidetes bacterium]|nr:DUF2490 domain-containing protein [Bacteroidota bacterium]MDA0950846.1 DUF2490 domain-containing protein [Bacteroidota bacterium]
MKKLLLLFALFPFSLLAQESDLGNWWIYFGDKKINARLNWHHEAQYRNYNFIGDTEQLLLRTGIGYNLSPQNNNLLLGYGFIQSEPYLENTNLKVRVDEHRIYQQFIHKQRLAQMVVQHRFRLEQRFVEQDFKMRFRYFLSLNMPLNKKELIDQTIYFSAYNEVFLNTAENLFDRNRIYAGIGYKFTKYVRSEIGLMNQSTSTLSRNQLNLITFIQL